MAIPAGSPRFVMPHPVHDFARDDRYLFVCYNSHCMALKYFIQTLGCQANKADSERVAGYLQSRGYEPTDVMMQADYVVINTCSIRQSAEDRVLSLVNDKLTPLKSKRPLMKIVLTGCMVGRIIRDKTGLALQKVKEQMPAVDEFLPIEEVGFDYPAIRQGKTHAWVSISNGCNNFCSFCIVPYSRGREVSRPFADIMHEVEHLVNQGYTEITLLGMNVNSYGADLLRKTNGPVPYIGTEAKFFDSSQSLSEKRSWSRQDSYKKSYLLPGGRRVKAVVVVHLGRYRIPTLFPYLLEEVAKHKELRLINFVSSNPWDFSDGLIDVIKKHKNITRTLHIALQAGDDTVLKRMNRWYTAEQFATLMERIRTVIPEVQFTTDIIVGFPGETEEQFQKTVELCKRIEFKLAYIAEYSTRPGTLATKHFVDDVPSWIKKHRFKILDEVINGNLHPERRKFGTPQKAPAIA